MLSSKIFLINIGDLSSIVSNDFSFYLDGYCVLVNLPTKENQNEWALAQIEKRNNYICFRIKFDDVRIFQGSNPQDVVNSYMDYYYQNTNKRYIIDGFEVFGMYSPIVWKLWSLFFPEKLQIKFGNVIRLKPRAELPKNFWVNSEDHSGMTDLFGLIVPSERNFEKMLSFMKDSAFENI